MHAFDTFVLHVSPSDSRLARHEIAHIELTHLPAPPALTAYHATAEYATLQLTVVRANNLGCNDACLFCTADCE
jgi:hypothetical protein